MFFCASPDAHNAGPAANEAVKKNAQKRKNIRIDNPAINDRQLRIRQGKCWARQVCG